MFFFIVSLGFINIICSFFERYGNVYILFMKSNIWKTINNVKYPTSKDCLEDLGANNFVCSEWIKDIFSKKIFEYSKNSYPINLIRIKVSDFGFNGPIELKEFYNKIEENNFSLVSPEIALYSRNIYNDQPTGEWLRFATPMDSLKDSDGVPHLPKLGKALGKYFVETYWSYPKAIFHPHNEFVVMKKDESTKTNKDK